MTDTAQAADVDAADSESEAPQLLAAQERLRELERELRAELTELRP